MSAEARRCGVALDESLRSVQTALAQLDGARALLYGAEPDVPDAAAVLRTWEAAGATLKDAVAASAQAAGWPSSLSVGSAGRLRSAALHLDAAGQAAALPPDDRRIAARWIAVALAPDPTALGQRLSALPPIRDLGDAQARLEWVNPRAGSALPIPGLSRRSSLRIRDWSPPIRGKRCIGPGGAAPVRDAAEDASAVARLLGIDERRLRVASVVGYKVFVEGGPRILDLVPQPLVCGNHLLTAREVRRRLRAAYRDALDKHAVKDRLCPVRAGKCPDEVAASVRRLFGLRRPELAEPAPPESHRPDFPPPFGFSEEWVQKLDRCAQEACEALSRLRSEAPFGQFDGPVCLPREPGVERPQEVMLASPESPSSITLSSCDAHAGVRLTLRRLREAGTLVAIASSHPFRYGSENVTRQGRHPQLGRIYERVADLTDPDDVSRRADSVFEVALTPTVANQVFYFFSLRRRDY